MNQSTILKQSQRLFISSSLLNKSNKTKSRSFSRSFSQSQILQSSWLELVNELGHVASLCNLLHFYSVLRIYCQAQIDHFSQLEGYAFSVNRRQQNFLLQLLLVFASRQWGLSMQKLVDHDTKRPYFSFRAILMQQQSFRAHINGTTNINIFERLTRFNSKSKISDFDRARTGKKNVGRLEISMNNVMLIQIKQPFVRLVEKSREIFFMEKLVSKQNLFKIPTFIELSYNVTIIFAGKYIMAFDDILMIELFYDPYLVSEQLICNLGGQGTIFYYFDGDVLTGILVNPLEYLTEVAFSDLAGRFVKIILDLFIFLGQVFFVFYYSRPAEHFNFLILIFPFI